MAFIKIEDIYGEIEAICFPKVFEKSRDVLKEEQIVRLSGKIQIKDGVAQIIADSVDALEVKEQEVKAVEQEYMGVILPDDKTGVLDDVLDVLQSYEGNIPVIIAMNGKKYSANVAVRKCEGLLSELKNFVREEDIIFFRKKS